jgi:N-acetylmuramoyl-L-alanine amidase
MSSITPDSRHATQFIPSPNHGERPRGVDLLILHYTGMPSCDGARDWLCNPASKVSCHYLIDESGETTQLVQESRRAWHAGVSSWTGDTDTNSRSIGIEIANPGHDHGYPEFPREQIAAVIALCRDIVSRHSISPAGVLAHSDVAPARKRDPGELFPWDELFRAGIGLWVPPAPLGADALSLGTRGQDVATLQKRLAAYGYGVATNGFYGDDTRLAVTAFQRHFRPARVDGLADRSTLDTLDALLAARGATTLV